MSDATHCMALLSSVAWEANYFGIKSMICIPNAELIFDKTDLKQIYSLKKYDIDFLKREINKFIN